MNKVVRDMIMRRRRDNDYDMNYDRDYDRAYDRGYDEAFDRAYRQGYDRGFDEAHNFGEDGRRGVRGTGRYGIGGSQYRGRRDRESEEEMSLTKEDMKEWKKKLAMGEHFSMPQIEQAMRSLDIRPKEYTEEELCMTANALYSDYYKTTNKIIPKDKETLFYVSMAKDFLEDKDAAVEGSEKLATYYYCIANEE